MKITQILSMCTEGLDAGKSVSDFSAPVLSNLKVQKKCPL